MAYGDICIECGNPITSHSATTTLRHRVCMTKTKIPRHCQNCGCTLESHSDKTKFCSSCWKQNSAKAIDIFKTWSSDMSYLLGLLFADGCLFQRTVRIDSKDLEHLEKIAAFLECKPPAEMVSHNKKRKRTYRWSRLQVNSAELARQLPEYGLHPHNSLTMKFPEVPSRYLPSFVLGYFDGDGGVFQDKRNGNISAKFTSGSLDFLRALGRHLANALHVRYQDPRLGSKSFVLSYFQKDSIKLFSFMYSSPTKLFLQIKKTRFEDYLGIENGLYFAQLPFRF